MKIDESCINHNAVRIIGELVSTCYDIVSDNAETERGFAMMTLGEIQGVIDLANALKEVLKV